MSFKLSQRSLSKLEGVHPELIEAVKRAIELTKVDFGCIAGTRTIAEQEANVAAGLSQTMKSKHLPQEDGYSHAVDLMAYVNNTGVWEINVYDEIADAMKEAAEELGVAVKWGRRGLRAIFELTPEPLKLPCWRMSIYGARRGVDLSLTALISRKFLNQVFCSSALRISCDRIISNNV